MFNVGDIVEYGGSLSMRGTVAGFSPRGSVQIHFFNDVWEKAQIFSMGWDKAGLTLIEAADESMEFDV